jgi:hypothetical protein
MQSPDPNMFAIAPHPFPASFINASPAAFGTYGPPPPGASYVGTAPPNGFTFTSIPIKPIVQECRRPFTSRSASFSAPSNTQIIRRTRAGHVSKTRVSKRNESNLTKICPSCSKLWRLCNCSNVKNRPAPKPYCKFVPPRMLKKQDDAN